MHRRPADQLRAAVPGAENDGVVACYHPANRHERTATWDEATNPGGRWRSYDHDEIVARDKASLDVFWLKDDALEASANLPAPEIIAAEIVEELRAALLAFEELESALSGTAGPAAVRADGNGAASA